MRTKTAAKACAHNPNKKLSTTATSPTVDVPTVTPPRPVPVKCPRNKVLPTRAVAMSGEAPATPQPKRKAAGPLEFSGHVKAVKNDGLNPHTSRVLLNHHIVDCLYRRRDLGCLDHPKACAPIDLLVAVPTAVSGPINCNKYASRGSKSTTNCLCGIAITEQLRKACTDTSAQPPTPQNSTNALQQLAPGFKPLANLVHSIIQQPEANHTHLLFFQLFVPVTQNKTPQKSLRLIYQHPIAGALRMCIGLLSELVGQQHRDSMQAFAKACFSSQSKNPAAVYFNNWAYPKFSFMKLFQAYVGTMVDNGKIQRNEAGIIVPTARTVYDYSLVNRLDAIYDMSKYDTYRVLLSGDKHKHKGVKGLITQQFIQIGDYRLPYLKGDNQRIIGGPDHKNPGRLLFPLKGKFSQNTREQETGDTAEIHHHADAGVFKVSWDGGLLSLILSLGLHTFPIGFNQVNENAHLRFTDPYPESLEHSGFWTLLHKLGASENVLTPALLEQCQELEQAILDHCMQLTGTPDILDTEWKCAILPSFLLNTLNFNNLFEKVTQAIHFDWKPIALEGWLQEKRLHCFFATIPLTNAGATLRFWPNFDLEDESSHAGQIVFINLGNIGVYPSTLCHEGNISMDINGQPRLHAYIYMIPKDQDFPTIEEMKELQSIVYVNPHKSGQRYSQLLVQPPTSDRFKSKLLTPNIVEVIKLLGV